MTALVSFPTPYKLGFTVSCPCFGEERDHLASILARVEPSCHG